ncbi:DUF421 domain-containing protein [Virgibacillus oceani]|uniref:UPF0702 transmembrane protein YkjA n=1 Tax=Virgibacillus oceani TaxID=1479511 RepID=A0A917M9Y9_9BACI|nr:YetF domain-containing protein [Virgibacillus oceani]GGG87194.1 UPF0702 transmembrane protein YkjA [Virgibacillus oceani]
MDVLIDYLWTPVWVFLLGYLLVRLSGKRSVAEMNSLDLMIIMVVGTTISEPAVSKNNWVASWFSLVVVLCYLVLSRLILVNKLRPLLTNSPTVLIQDGNIDKQGLKKTRMNIELLLGVLRVKGYTDVNDIKIALMESSGQISVIPMSDKRPLQPSDMQMSPSPAFLSIPLIIDGEIIYHNLKFLKKNAEWLYEKMQAYNLDKNDLDLVTLATYNQQGMVKFDTTRKDGGGNGPYSYKPGNEN